LRPEKDARGKSERSRRKASPAGAVFSLFLTGWPWRFRRAREQLDDEVLEWVREALHASHADERREQEEAIKRHQNQYKRLNDRIHAIYVDKVDGVVDAAFFEKMSNQWREEQNRCQREIERHQEADKSYLDKGVVLLDLARNAQRLFAMQEPREKRRLLNFVLSNCSWEDGEVVATFREPFDMLAE
jgi:site-specific DNA recombinase